MSRDKSFLAEFLKNKILDLENNEMKESDFLLLRNYFLDTVLKDIENDEIKQYLFVGYCIIKNNK